MVSLCLHALLVLLLLRNEDRPGSPQPRRRTAVAISLEPFLPRPAPPAPAAAPPPAPPPPAAEVASAVPAVRPPARREAERRPPPAQKSAPPAAPAKAQPASAEEPPAADDLLGKIQDNWLRPPGTSGAFRCRLRIDYGAGGVILGVHLPEKCGAAVLDDSITRAVWKSQPIPLPAHAASSGSIEIEFSP